MKIHLWEAYNPRKISTNITEEFKNELKILIESKISKIAKRIKIHSTRLYEYFIYQKSPIPLNILIDLCKIFKIDLIKMEKEIIMYKHMYVPNKNSIQNPKLPLKTSPYFTSIIANLYFDGSVPKDGKGTYYNQKNEKIMNNFIEKIKSVFGDVQYSLKKDHRGVLKCSIPRIIGEICKQIYKIDSFGGNDSIISKKIYNLSKEHKTSFIITAILDEGSIAYDGTIMFGVNNKKLCEGVNTLCEQIDLRVNKIRKKKNSNFYYFHVLSLEKFLKLYEQINKKYPFISLGYKEKRLKESILIKKQKFEYTKKFADKRKFIILKELKKQKCSINYLSSKFLMPPRTIRRYMYKLIKEGKIKREKISNQYIYYLT